MATTLILSHISQHARLEIPMDLRDPIAFSPPRPASGKGTQHAAQFASIEFFHWLAIALNKRRQERFQRIDNSGRHCLSATMIEVARFKTPFMAAGLLDPRNELRPLIAALQSKTVVLNRLVLRVRLT